MKHIYVDGLELAADAVPILHDEPAPLIVGNDVDDGAFHAGLVGLLDELALFDRALAPAEIAALAHD